MVSADDEEMLREGLIVHRGPPPFDIIKDPVWTLANWMTELGASDLIVDSLKDLAPELSKDETGSAVNRAFQEATAGRPRARRAATTSASSSQEQRHRSDSPTSMGRAG